MNRSHSVSTPKRIIHQRRRRALRWGLGLVAAAIVIWGALIGLSYAQWGRVTEIVIIENPHIDQQTSKAAIEEALASHWFVMGNHDRHWTLPRKKIEDIMKVQSNTIRSVDMKYRDHHLVIDLHIFTPAFITCFGNGDCGFTSADGYVYDPSPEFSSGVYAVLQVPDETPVYDQGPRYLSDLQRMVVDMILLNSEGRWEAPYRVKIDLLDVHIFFDRLNGVPLPEGSYIMIGQIHVSDYQSYLSARLNALRSKTDFFDRLRSRTESFEYLDLRFEDKMYMKFQ